MKLMYYLDSDQVIHMQCGPHYWEQFEFDNELGKGVRLFSVAQCMPVDSSALMYLTIAVDYEWNYYLIVTALENMGFMTATGEKLYIRLEELQYMVDFDDYAEPQKTLQGAKEQADLFIEKLREVISLVRPKMFWRAHKGSAWLRHVEEFERMVLE